MNFLGNTKITHMTQEVQIKERKKQKKKKQPIQLTLKMYFDKPEVML